jgi:hypothetical protein
VNLTATTVVTDQTGPISMHYSAPMVSMMNSNLTIVHPRLQSNLMPVVQGVGDAGDLYNATFWVNNTGSYGVLNVNISVVNLHPFFTVVSISGNSRSSNTSSLVVPTYAQGTARLFTVVVRVLDSAEPGAIARLFDVNVRYNNLAAKFNVGVVHKVTY